MFERTMTHAPFAIIATLLSMALVHTIAEPPKTIDRNVLSASRGRNINNVLNQLLCNDLNGNFSCGANGNGKACVTCATNTYTAVVPGTSGGYDGNPNKTFFGCGNNNTGICNNLVCVEDNNTVGVCADPPGPPRVQPN